ncbi:hypothetical protein AVEN_39944-1 [Araneus ventricosus]|uniref:G-protein coupled receptors family 3 profile domain-containing protein n=1 Tax=Araneus ventricosus TaxID=182803 RepID=A0A4Y2PJW9_ARAVE|nr:hypothetical protein AVEN_39944-1 [Araneus ventricosus]
MRLWAVVYGKRDHIYEMMVLNGLMYCVVELSHLIKMVPEIDLILQQRHFTKHESRPSTDNIFFNLTSHLSLSRYLTFTNYTTCVIWLAFLPLFVLSTSNTIRSVTLSSLLSLSGAVQLACLFMPKVYIAVFKPEKNTKDAVMCPHNRNSSCLALPAAGLYQAPPSNLLNGGEPRKRVIHDSSTPQKSIYYQSYQSPLSPTSSVSHATQISSPHTLTALPPGEKP